MHCRICHNTAFKQILSVPDIRYRISNKYFDVIKCEYCGICITCEDKSIINPEPYYSSNYGAFIEPKGQTRASPPDKIHQPRKTSAILSRRLRIALNRFNWVQLVDIQSETKILDIGCGTGRIGSSLIETFFCEVSGIEPNATAAQLACNKGLHVHTGTLSDFSSKKQFDLVLLIHVLEHLRNPLHDIQRIHKILKPKGKLVIAVPNVDALERKIFNKYWDGWDIPRHVHHFSPDSLQYLLREGGFEPGEVYHERYSLFSRSLANKVFGDLPYHQRKNKNKFRFFEKPWGIVQPLLKSSSAIQVMATRI